ncbi:glycosyltransferase [Pengzhenrongella sicca]|uniref:Glycosyltransferase family 1 protein n=1 Tax=Pengzhenrongella sicca TaxID=2819238 RepID=A0A8A4ZC04_9MICO|nr:glycosyltransferase [Pengzhenrongella sicca]QTE28126.1 glycosyltransferase family 1 protein [Pengzhenrongella sicca]
MRLLFTFAGGEGHLQPMLPLARTAADAGHTVAVTGALSLEPTVRGAGLEFIATGPDVRPQRRALQPIDLAAEYRVVGEYFAGRLAAARSADLLALCADARPDVVVHDEMDFGSAVMAEREGIPHASVIVIGAGSFVRPDQVAEPLSQLRADHGLPADPDLEMLTRGLILCPFPRSFRDPTDPLPPSARFFRREHVGRPGPSTPLLERLAGGPTVYLTLGTIFNTESGDLFSRVLAGVRELDVQVVVTVGRGLDPAELGPVPRNVRVERYVPQAALLPHCAAVISHGGSGSVLGALTHGLPMVCIPLGADQPLNAARCTALGVGRVLDALTLTPDDVIAAASAVLAEPRYRDAAAQVQAEIVDLPSHEDTLALLEDLPYRRR